jgi:uncharacterized protein YaeQ
MALTATIHRFEVTLSDVDRGVYESLDLRVARHPSESPRYLMTRLLGYCLSYEEGMAFSKGGLSSSEEPPLAVRDRTGQLLVWIEVGSPSAERLHKASKAAGRVVLYTHADAGQLRKEASTRAIHRVEAIDVRRFDPALLDALAGAIDRHTKVEIVRTDGRLYMTIGSKVIEGDVEQVTLG